MNGVIISCLITVKQRLIWLTKVSKYSLKIFFSTNPEAFNGHSPDLAFSIFHSFIAVCPKIFSMLFHTTVFTVFHDLIPFFYCAIFFFSDIIGIILYMCKHFTVFISKTKLLLLLFASLLSIVSLLNFSFSLNFVSHA